MISIISIGIAKYNDKTISEISCAHSDAKKVYSTFKYVLGRDFSDFSSICLLNASKNEFISLLSGISSALSYKDTIILYFSCHARLNSSDEFILVFSDADEAGNGQLTATYLKEILTRYNSEYILFLDCCHSETALKMANKSSPSSRSNISVIASTEYYLRAKYDSDGSFFTKILCEAVTQLYENGQDITLNSIASEINVSGATCYTNLAEGKIDFPLKKVASLTNNYPEFPRIFMSKLSNNRLVREMMWYSLSNIPSKISLVIINQFILDSAKVSEADWLVRRAIGSLLSTMKGDLSQINKTTLKMLYSDNWMRQTIGLIACRHNIDYKTADMLQNMIISEDNPMSLVWLADLYLSDSQFANLDVSLKSNLAKTGWGLIQIWDRYKQKYEPRMLFNTICNNIADNQILKQLQTEIYLSNNDQFGFDERDITCEQLKASNNKLVSILYRSSPRGRTIDNNKKWLLSIMYGSWRGQLNINFDEYFNNTKDNKIIRELKLARYIPSPSKRACIFSYMQYSPNIFEKYRSNISWGISDPHPWVRREAILAFKNYPEMIQLAFNDVIDRHLFIGTFDLIINASRYIDKSFLRNYVKKYDLTPCERTSLLLSIMNE